jgi:hypothetical protein
MTVAAPKYRAMRYGFTRVTREENPEGVQLMATHAPGALE